LSKLQLLLKSRYLKHRKRSATSEHWTRNLANTSTIGKPVFVGNNELNLKSLRHLLHINCNFSDGSVKVGMNTNYIGMQGYGFSIAHTF